MRRLPMGKKESSWRYFASGKSIYVGGKKTQRRWKVLDGQMHLFKTGDIVLLDRDDHTDTPYFHSNTCDSVACCLSRLVEIDAMGDTIRTYAKGDTLDGGTLIGGKDMDKKEAMKRLRAIGAEITKLKEIINAPAKIVYDKSKIYVSYDDVDHGVAILIGRDNAYAFYTLSGGTEWAHSPTCTTAQAAINEEVQGYAVEVFSNRKQALAFFLSRC